MFEVPDKPDAATLAEWDSWETSARRDHPVRYFLSETLPCWWSITWRRWVHDPWYWVKCRVWHRYNVVVCRRLPPTWCDRDQLMLHACFQLLEDFVEQEDPWELREPREKVLEVYSWTAADGTVHTVDAEGRVAARDELLRLLAWWRGYDPSGWDESDPLDEKKRAIENENLKKLIDLRGGMWT